jgi:hypothetical protein
MMATVPQSFRVRPNTTSCRIDVDRVQIAKDLIEALYVVIGR